METQHLAAVTDRSANRKRTGLATFTQRWWRRSIRLSAGTRALALFLIAAFGLAGLAPPCEAHGAMHDGGHGASTQVTHHDHHGHDGSDGQGSHGGNGSQEDCTCLADCQRTITVAITSGGPSLPRLAVRSQPAPSRPAIPRVNQRFILPYATAPPVGS